MDPEVGGRIDFGAEDHEQTMLALGLQSKREIARTRIRVRTAMATQTREQGRYLGGRPPYGYRLTDAGPHPNEAHAAWGRRAHQLEPDPDTAPVVRWLCAQRLAGHSAARITRALNDAGIPCPSVADPGRNPHRTGAAWTLRTVAGSLSSMIAAATAISAIPASTMDRVPGSAASRPLASGSSPANSTSRAGLTAPVSRISASTSLTAASAASRRCGSVMISCHRYRRRISWNQRCWSCSTANIRASHSRCSTTAQPAVSSFRKPGIRSRGGGSVNAASMIAAR